MEPGDGLHEGESGMCALLCGTDVTSAACDGAGELCQRIPGDGPRTCAVAAVGVETAPDGIRKFNGGSVSRAGACGVHTEGVRDDARGPLARVPSVDEAI